jgi:DhnA family fructose-bisphosphate aldolase class Ia
MRMVYDAISVGDAGVAIGRNIFQADDPTLIVRKLCAIVHDGYSAEEAEKLKF